MPRGSCMHAACAAHAYLGRFNAQRVRGRFVRELLVCVAKGHEREQPHLVAERIER